MTSIDNLPLAARKELLVVRAEIERIEAFRELVDANSWRKKQTRLFSFFASASNNIGVALLFIVFFKMIRSKKRGKHRVDASKIWLLLSMLRPIYQIWRSFFKRAS